jgi:hypothetical protein
MLSELVAELFDDFLEHLVRSQGLFEGFAPMMGSAKMRVFSAAASASKKAANNPPDLARKVAVA